MAIPAQPGETGQIISDLLGADVQQPAFGRSIQSTSVGHSYSIPTGSSNAGINERIDRLAQIASGQAPASPDDVGQAQQFLGERVTVKPPESESFTFSGGGGGFAMGVGGRKLSKAGARRGRKAPAVPKPKSPIRKPTAGKRKSSTLVREKKDIHSNGVAEGEARAAGTIRGLEGEVRVQKRARGMFKRGSQGVAAAVLSSLAAAKTIGGIAHAPAAFAFGGKVAFAASTTPFWAIGAGVSGALLAADALTDGGVVKCAKHISGLGGL